MLKEICARAEKICTECETIVRELVTADRSRGLDGAFDRVARASGLTARRVRSHWYGEVAAGTVAAHEIEALRGAYADHLRLELARCEHRAALLRARLSSGASEGAFLAPSALASAA